MITSASQSDFGFKGRTESQSQFSINYILIDSLKIDLLVKKPVRQMNPDEIWELTVIDISVLSCIVS